MSSKIRSVFPWLAVILRWAMGAVFIYMGFSKVLDPVGFLKLVREYNFVTNPILLNCIAATLPWFEVLCGLLLVIGVAVRGTALILVALLVPFTLLVLNRAMDIMNAQAIAFCAVKFDCGCGAGEVFICHKLLENSLLALGCAWLMTGIGWRLSLRHGVSPARETPSASRPS